MESARRVRQLEAGDTRPCATAGCEEPRHRLPSQWSSYCHEHHLLARRRTFYRTAYGLTIEQYDELMERAGRACQVCRSRKRLVVDHCHETGTVRGVLCNDCNVALGTVKDDVDRIMALATYLLAGRDVIASPGDLRSAGPRG